MSVDELSWESELRRRRLLLGLLVLGLLAVSLLLSDERRLFGGRAIPRAFAAIAEPAASGPPSVVIGGGGFSENALPPVFGAPFARPRTPATGPLGGLVPGAPTQLADNLPGDGAGPPTFGSGDVLPGGGVGGGDGGLPGGGFPGGGSFLPVPPDDETPTVPAPPTEPVPETPVPPVVPPVPPVPPVNPPVPPVNPPVTPPVPPTTPPVPPTTPPTTPPVTPPPPETPVTPVPEPETWVAMVIGMGAVGGMLRVARRRRADRKTVVRP